MSIGDNDLDMETVLLVASSKNHVEVVKFLMSHGVSLNAKDKDGNGALALGARNGHLPVVEVLVKKGIHVNERHQNLMSALHFACENNHVRIAEFLISKGAIVNTKDKVDNGALALCSRNGHLSVAQFLVKEGVSVNERHEDMETALHLACRMQHGKVVEFLLCEGADLNAKSKENLRPFDNIKTPVRDLVRDMETVLLVASSKNYVEVVKFLMTHGVSLNAKDKDGNGALALGARNGHLPVVEVLVKKGIHVNERHEGLMTALHFACEGNHVTIAEFLISKHADVNIRDQYNRVPHELATGNLKNIVRFARLYAEGTVSLECLKICFIGEELAGKTTLAEAIQRRWFRHLFSAAENAPDKDIVGDRTAGMVIYQADISSIGLSVLCDFAGQELFLGTHTLFFDEFNSFFILLLNALLSKAEMLRQSQRWLAFLRAALRRGAFPVVVIAVSRADGCDRQKAVPVIQEVVTELKIMFQSQVNIQERFFLLDCRKSQSREMIEFRNFLGQLKKEMLQTDKKYPRLCEPVIKKLLPRLRKQDVPQIVTKSDLTALVKKEVKMPAQKSDILDDMVEFLHVNGEVFVLDDLAAFNVPWLSHSVLGPVMASEKFPVHLKAAESRREEGTATKEEMATVLENFQVQQGKRPENINTEYAIKGLQMMGVAFELSDRPGVYCIPAHLPHKDRNEMWPEDLEKIVYVGRRVECLHEVDVFTIAFFVFFQSKAAATFSRKSVLWSGGIIIPHVAEEEVYVECLVELTKEKKAVDLIARGREKSERHCLAFLTEVYDMLDKTMAEKSPGTETSRHLLHLPDIQQRKKEPIGFSKEDVEAAAAAGKAVIVTKSNGRVIDAHIRDLMAMSEPQTGTTMFSEQPEVEVLPVTQNDDHQSGQYHVLHEDGQPAEISSQRVADSSNDVQPKEGSMGHDATASPSTVESQSSVQFQVSRLMSPVLRAVQRHGSSRWLALAVAMGYTMDEADVAVRNSYNPSDSLMAIFLKKVAELGLTAAEESLLGACEDITPSIHTAVLEELDKSRLKETLV